MAFNASRTWKFLCRGDFLGATACYDLVLWIYKHDEKQKCDVHWTEGQMDVFK